MTKKEKKKKVSKFYKIVSFILLITTVISLGFLVYFDVLPLKYLLILGLFVFIVVLCIVRKLNKRTNLFTKLVCMLLTIIIMFIEGLGIVYSYGTVEFFNNIIDTGYHNESYGLYTLNNKYKNYKDLKDLKVGYKNEEAGTDKALKKLNEKVKVKT